MLLIERPPLPRHEIEDPEALIKEAKRLRRRRWAIGTTSLAALIGAITAVILLTESSSEAPSVPRAAASAGVLPNGRFRMLNIAGPMAISRDGVLYSADDTGTGMQLNDQVLVRLPDGRFRVIAGTGRRASSATEARR